MGYIDNGACQHVGHDAAIDLSCIQGGCVRLTIGLRWCYKQTCLTNVQHAVLHNQLYAVPNTQVQDTFATLTKQTAIHEQGDRSHLICILAPLGCM